jgi:hypothetical protein
MLAHKRNSAKIGRRQLQALVRRLAAKGSHHELLRNVVAGAMRRRRGAIGAAPAAHLSGARTPPDTHNMMSRPAA